MFAVAVVVGVAVGVAVVVGVTVAVVFAVGVAVGVVVGVVVGVAVTMMRVLGIDPGLDGAVVLIDPPYYQDTPTLKVGKGGKRTYNVVAMARILGGMTDGFDAHVFIEKQQARPKQGVSSTFSTGFGFGLWLGIISAFELPHTVVTPQEWTRETYRGIPAEGKDRSILACERLFPTICLSKPKGRKPTMHGRADAALIAEYGRRMLGVRVDPDIGAGQ